MKQIEKEIMKDYDSWYFCPLCLEIHEFAKTCYDMLDEKFTHQLLLEFKEINDQEDKKNRTVVLSKNQMKMSSDKLEEMK
jgi:hypothetical protein